MDIKVYKKNDDIETELVNDDGKSETFSNLKMIDYFYKNGSENVEIIFDDEVTEDEKKKILTLYNEIKKCVENLKKQ